MQSHTILRGHGGITPMNLYALRLFREGGGAKKAATNKPLSI